MSKAQETADLLTVIKVGTVLVCIKDHYWCGRLYFRVGEKYLVTSVSSVVGVQGEEGDLAFDDVETVRAAGFTPRRVFHVLRETFRPL